MIGNDDELSDEEIYNTQFALEDITNIRNNLPNNYLLENHQLGGYEKCCIGCGKIAVLGCMGLQMLTCCTFLKKAEFLYQLETSEAGIVEEFGKFTRMLHPGLNIINPCSEDVISVDLRIKSFSLGKQNVLTRDNISLTVEAAIYYRIINPIKAAYGMGVNHIQNGIQEAAFDIVRNSFGEHNLDEILMARNNYIESTRNQLMSKLDKQGVLIQNIFLTQLQLPKSIQQSLSVVPKQKRLSEALVISSTAKVQVANLIKQSSELLNSKSAMQIRYLEMLQQLAHEGKQMKILVPLSINSVGKR